MQGEAFLFNIGVTYLLYPLNRMDSTLVDFTDMKWQRGDLTFTFNGDAKGTCTNHSSTLRTIYQAQFKNHISLIMLQYLQPGPFKLLYSNSALITHNSNLNIKNNLIH